MADDGGYEEEEISLLAPPLETARHDPATIGLILHGSRGAGLGDAESDYDLIWVLTEHKYERRVEAGERLEETTVRDGRKLVEIAYTCPRRLADPATPGWIIQGLATARVLLDKSGEVAKALSALVTIPEEKARSDELGARLQAAESLIYLIRALFALERRWPPFHDRLSTALDTLESQGWRPGELQDLVLVIMRTGDPRLQAQLEERVEALPRERGNGEVVDTWDGEIERVKQEIG